MIPTQATYRTHTCKPPATVKVSARNATSAPCKFHKLTDSASSSEVTVLSAMHEAAPCAATDAAVEVEALTSSVAAETGVHVRNAICVGMTAASSAATLDAGTVHRGVATSALAMVGAGFSRPLDKLVAPNVNHWANVARLAPEAATEGLLNRTDTSVTLTLAGDGDSTTH